MNKYEIEAMQESANFLFENRMPRYFLWDVLNSSFKAKRDLMQMLDLKEENGYRVEIPVDNNVDDEFSFFVDYLCKALTKRDNAEWKKIDKTFIMDSRKNKYKVSKVVSPQVFDMMLRIAEIGGSRNRDRLRNLASYGAGCSTLCSAECVRKFSIWWGEQIKKGMKLILSAHPVDILTASQNSSFTSCYSPGGGYFNGVITSMMSPDTLIATVEEVGRPGYKIGRSWIYVNSDMIICARKYGGINDTHHLHIRNFIQSKIGGDWVLKNDEWQISDMNVDMKGPGYLDRGYGRVAIRKDLNDDNMDKVYSKVKKIIMPEIICLFCGTRYGKSSNIKGICRKCVETVSQRELEE